MSNWDISQAIPLEQLMVRNLIRYERLDSAIPYAFWNCNSNKLNIYIDLYGFYRTLYSRHQRTLITDPMGFTSSIIDLCVHYRGYFKRYGITTKIFLISSYNTPEHTGITNYNPEMKQKLKLAGVRGNIEFNLEILNILCPYLPDIFFLKTEFESSVLMNELIIREGNTPSLIISTDLLPIQLCSIHENVAYIWPFKIKSGNDIEDISPICPPRNHSEHELSFSYIIRRKQGKTTSDRISTSVIASNFVLLEALFKFEDRKFPTLMSKTAATRIIIETPGGTETKLYPRDIFSHPLLANKPEEFLRNIELRFNALDVGIQSNFFNSSIEYSTLKYENLTDPDALNLINSKYFANNPLNLFLL